MNVLRVSALVVALSAGTTAWMMSRGLESEPAEAPVVQEPLEVEQVLVAAKGIEPGRAVSTADLRWDTWPRGAVSPRFIIRSDNPDGIEELAGTVTRGTIAAGEPIQASKLIRAGRGGYMSAVLPQGSRAVSMRTSPQTGAGGFILPNDRVDVILIRPDSENLDPATENALRYASERILENIRVLAIDQTVEEQDGKTVVIGSVATLELTPQQVETLTRAQQLGELSLALRSVLDGETVTAEPLVRHRNRSVNVVKFGRAGRVGVN